jgi:hypothetical protein
VFQMLILALLYSKKFGSLFLYFFSYPFSITSSLSLALYFVGFITFPFFCIDSKIFRGGLC